VPEFRRLQLLEQLQASPVFILLGRLVVLLSSLITSSNGLSILINSYRSTIGRKRILPGISGCCVPIRRETGPSPAPLETPRTKTG
jgi:hypothetical protein